MAKTQYRLFSCPLLVLAWMAMLALLLGLALWQVQRGQEKTRLLAGFTASSDASLIHELENEQAKELLRQGIVFVRACFTGHYESDRQFLLDGQTQGGQVGFNVWTPLERSAGDRLLVNRGWIQQSAERRPLASLEVDHDMREVCGTLVRFPRSAWSLSAASTGSQWPRVVVYPSVQEIEQTLGSPIYPLLLLLDEDQPDGYLRLWKPVTMAPEQHYGYALQWAALALTWVVMTAIFWRHRRRESGKP